MGGSKRSHTHTHTADGEVGLFLVVPHTSVVEFRTSLGGSARPRTHTHTHIYIYIYTVHGVKNSYVMPIVANGSPTLQRKNTVLRRHPRRNAVNWVEAK